MLGKNKAILLAGLFVLMTAAIGLAQGETVTLKYDDGDQDTKRSMTGAGHAVRFECPDDEKWYVKAVALHGSRYGSAQAPNEDFITYVASDDMKKTCKSKHPYRLFERGNETWVRYDIQPVEVQGAFQIVVFFNPTQTKGVYVGVDSDSKPTHSTIVVPSDPSKNSSDLEGDWMIRAILTKSPIGETVSLLSAEDQTAQETRERADRDAAILGDARSLTLKHDDGVMDKELNVGGAIYTVAYDTPKNVECYVWQVEFYASQFGGRHDSEEVSGDVYILDENRKIITRTTFPYSLLTQQKDWIAVQTLPTKVQGRFYVALDCHGGQYKGVYVGYKEGNKEGLASTDERVDDVIAPADWSTKFAENQWMIRAKVADRPVVYVAE